MKVWGLDVTCVITKPQQDKTLMYTKSPNMKVCGMDLTNVNIKLQKKVLLKGIHRHVMKVCLYAMIVIIQPPHSGILKYTNNPRMKV